MIPIEDWKKLQRLYVNNSTKRLDDWYLEQLMKAIEDFKEFHGATGMILDVGSGMGTEDRMKRGYSYLPDSGKIKIDPELPADRENFVRGVAEYFPFEEGVFDTVLVVSVLDHLFALERGMKECSRVLRHGGKINVFQKVYGSYSEDDHHSFFFTSDSLLRLIGGEFSIVEWKTMDWVEEQLMFVKGEKS